MNWLIKLSKKFASLSGEYWIMDGQSIGADGDIGPTNHDGHVMEHIFGSVFGDPDEMGNDDLWMRLVDNMWTEEEAQEIESQFPGYTTYAGLPKEYAVEKLGWIRVIDSNFEAQTVNENVLREIIGHCEENMFGSEDEEICINEHSTGAYLCFDFNELKEAVNSGQGITKFRLRQRVSG